MTVGCLEGEVKKCGLDFANMVDNKRKNRE